MSEQVSDFLLKRLSAWGIKRIYGFPGDGINGIMGPLNRAGDLIKFVQVRHEEMAAFMACAHSKFTGEVGVCLATSGPGAIHLLNGLYDAKMDHQSVVAIIGQQARSAPTLPPHISFKEAEMYAKALIKGDPEEIGIIRQTFKDAVESFLPHKK